MGKKNICLIGDVCHPGGAERFNEKLVRHLMKKHTLYVFSHKKRKMRYFGQKRKLVFSYKPCLKEKKNLKIFKFFESSGWNSIDKEKKALEESKKILSVLKRKKIDLVHCSLSSGKILQAFFVAQGLNKPLSVTVSSFRSLLFFSKSKELRKGQRKKFFAILRSAEHVFAVSNEIKNFLKKKAVKKISVVSSGVNSKKFKPKKKVIEENILYVGNADKVKGAVIVLRAFKKIAKKINEKLLMVGIGLNEKTRKEKDLPIKEPLLSEICNDKRINFIGRVTQKELLELYQKAKIFVLSSLSEGMPTAVLEAMACEKIVIVSRVGGLKDLIVNGKNGFSVESNNSKQLAEKILYVTKNFEKLGKLKKNARKTAKKHEEKKNLLLYEKKFAKIIKGKHGF